MRRARLCILLLVFAVGAELPETTAAEPDLEARKARLKKRSRAWLEARRALLFQTGRRVRVSRKTFFKLYYDMRSPAWRARQGAPETLELKFASMDAGKGRPRAVSRFAVVGAELVTERYGIGRYKMNGLEAVREVRWVWADGDWYLYGGDVDGTWAVPVCDASPSRRKALSKNATAKIATTLSTLKLTHAVKETAGAGDAQVVVVLELKGAHTAKARTDAVRADAIAVTRALLAKDAACSGVRIAFLGDWIDRFGQVQVGPHVHVCLDRATYDRIVFANLKSDEVYALFRVRAFTHEGLKLRTP